MRVCLVLLFTASFFMHGALAQSLHPRLLDSGSTSGLPRVKANDNRTPAGSLKDGILELNLEVGWADWRIETAEGPGLRVAAIAESGQEPMVPGPLVRVETGTNIRVRVRNTLTDSSITVFGLQSRPAEAPDSLVIAPGATGDVAFEAGEPGTYFYWIQLGAAISMFEEEHEQLAGAFIIDPVGGSPADRVLVMNVFSVPVDTALHDYGWFEALTINGLSWPYTERFRPAVGDSIRWRIINASQRGHPMHLHGFFYDVTSIGSYLKDTVYEPKDYRAVVTERMPGRSTMVMEWVASRPGNWLFHCHLSFHVTPAVRLPGTSEGHDDHSQPHMAGLISGIEIQPGPSDLIERGEPLHLTLNANEYSADTLHQYRFSLDKNANTSGSSGTTPGPLLVLKQYQTTYVTVENHMTIPTGVHWHGLELDSWADGVPGWSASDGQMSPVIQPGEKFTYKLSLMRPGTFIYHSHLDDINQLTGGLYGPLLVFAEGDTYNPETDHVFIFGWNSPNPSSPKDLELNGRQEHPTQHTSVGETHRIRVINIAPAGNVTAHMLLDDAPVLLKAIAKDGADLPIHQQVDLEVSPKMGVGETADFAFTPSRPGTYELVIGTPRLKWRQKWVVVAGDELK